MKSLPLKFYRRDTTQVAKELLGKKLFHRSGGALTGGIICETEAYLGVKDRAAHTFSGHRSPRVESMYLAGGHSYVYFIYGVHFCFNVVTQNEGEPEAVLIRALFPTDGIPTMSQRRKLKSLQSLCSGPGKLCQALAIDRGQNGLALNSSELWISKGIDFSRIEKRIQAGPRIGIPRSGEAKLWPLRFHLHPEKDVASLL